ncbi:sugar phosphate isomerase/epimerase family protein [Curtobacterium sp. Leaf261]|uniref:sugar phosphate isomerase/epimerase family protein n=1 Tax=Curtobacterium sp. Leaf261 TaxID=1736311 RepID=UPI000A892385|nr:sugar phosphate isomerase/epimerase [Curtobacterium sp. Leaf261]
MASQISVQLYTVRDAIAADLPGTLRRLRDIGFEQVELFGYTDRADEYVTALADAGLTAPSGHAKLIGTDVEQILTASASLGMGTVIDPHIDEERWITRADVEAIARELSAVATRAADHGLAVGYHNHAFELENRIDGVPALQVFADALHDDVVIELDTYWAEVGGVPAAAFLELLGDRVQFLHVKDGPKTKDDKEQTAVGAGAMPIEEILAAAPNALRVIELDDHDGDVFQAVTESYAFLNGVRA